MKPALSILVPCYNVEKYLRQCLDSVVGQALRNIEIICINDGSTDSTLDILREYAARDPRISIIDKKNTGYGDSMNRGLEAASGEYIGIVESDDWADADMFERLYAAAKEHDCDLVKSNFYDYCGGVSTLNEIIPQEHVGQVIVPRQFFSVMKHIAYIWAGIYRRVWLEKCDIRFLATPGASLQDNSFGFKLLACAKRAFLMQEAWLHYRKDNIDSSVHNNNKLFCICDEFHEIENVARKHPEWERQFVSFIYYLKYAGYLWNFRRLDVPWNWRFASTVAKEFRQDFQNGNIDPPLFSRKHLARLKLWAFHPLLFLCREHLIGPGRKKLLRALKRG